MDYQKIYNVLIERARNRTITSYTERHHIVPRCIGGSDDASNLVRLTPEEHYLAHQLLVKVHPGNRSLILAMNSMARSCRGKRNNKLYGWVRRRVGAAMREMKLGIPRTPEVRAKLSAANKGKKASQEARAKMSAVRRGRKHSQEHAAAISASLMGKKSSAACVEKFKKMLAARTPEEISKAARKAFLTRVARGYKHPNLGRKLSDIHKLNIGKAGLGRKHTEESKQKMRLHALLREAKRRELKAMAHGINNATNRQH